jgi:hypothetical protein
MDGVSRDQKVKRPASVVHRHVSFSSVPNSRLRDLVVEHNERAHMLPQAAMAGEREAQTPCARLPTEAVSSPAMAQPLPTRCVAESLSCRSLVGCLPSCVPGALSRAMSIAHRAATLARTCASPAAQTSSRCAVLDAFATIAMWCVAHRLCSAGDCVARRSRRTWSKAVFRVGRRHAFLPCC